MGNQIKGKLKLNEAGRYQIENSNYYFTSGDGIELYDSDEGVWLRGRIEHDFKRNCYYAIITVKGWSNIEQEETIYNLECWEARVPIVEFKGEF